MLLGPQQENVMKKVEALGSLCTIQLHLNLNSQSLIYHAWTFEHTTPLAAPFERGSKLRGSQVVKIDATLGLVHYVQIVATSDFRVQRNSWVWTRPKPASKTPTWRLESGGHYLWEFQTCKVHHNFPSYVHWTEAIEPWIAQGSVASWTGTGDKWRRPESISVLTGPLALAPGPL